MVRKGDRPMTAKWGICAIAALCLALTLGCRSPQPILKPEKIPEKLVEPPQEARYDTPGYPKQAYDKLADPSRSVFDAKTNGVVPTRGSSMGGGGMNGMGGYR